MNVRYDPERVRREVPREPIGDEVRALYLRPGELLAMQDRFPVAFQPLGTIEWHGRHNPLGCDSIKAERLCVETARRVGGVVMPTVHFAVDAVRDCGHGLGVGMDAAAGFLLPGTFLNIDGGLLKAFLINACRNYLARGFRLVILVSGHNPEIQQLMMQEVCYHFLEPDGREPVCCTMEYAVLPPGDPRRSSDHAAGYETSMMLYLNGDRVRMDANDRTDDPGLGQHPFGDFTFDRATAEEGRIRFAMQVEGLSRLAVSRLAALDGVSS